MSVKYSSVYGCGLFITGELMEEIALNYNASADEEDIMEPDELACEMGLTRFGDVEGEFIPFDESLSAVELDCELFYMLPLEKAKSLFSQAYRDTEEVESEIVAKMQKYVPVDFDYRSKLGEIVGTSLD